MSEKLIPCAREGEREMFRDEYKYATARYRRAVKREMRRETRRLAKREIAYELADNDTF